MNPKDGLVLSHLRSNARISLTKMSKQTQIPVSTLFDKLKRFEQGLIKKYVSLIDFQQLGYNTRAQIVLKINKDQRKECREFLTKHLNVNSVYKINNGFDFMVDCVFKNIKDMEEFIEAIEDKFEIIERYTYYVIDEIKKEEFLANRNLVGLV
ncbi:Lrp/AsnC family transcriptional regulator [Candidatus Woesearchaeota archaeon]|nr:Lrp/AsnC family transcriptional regulator [Candidatus Woesearchaeota archaeon]